MATYNPNAPKGTAANPYTPTEVAQLNAGTYPGQGGSGGGSGNGGGGIPAYTGPFYDDANQPHDTAAAAQAANTQRAIDVAKAATATQAAAANTPAGQIERHELADATASEASKEVENLNGIIVGLQNKIQKDYGNMIDGNGVFTGDDAAYQGYTYLKGALNSNIDKYNTASGIADRKANEEAAEKNHDMSFNSKTSAMVDNPKDYSFNSQTSPMVDNSGEIKAQQAALKQLDSVKSGDGSNRHPFKYDVVSFLRDGGDTKTLSKAGFSDESIKQTKEIADKPESKESFMDRYIQKNYGNSNTYADIVKTISAEGESGGGNTKADKMFKAALKAYTDKYGKGAFYATQAADAGTLLFAPARALRPEVTIQEISKEEWVFGAAQVAMFVVAPVAGAVIKGAAGAGVAKAIQLGAGAVFFKDTADNWDDMTPTQRVLSVVMDTLIIGTAIPKAAELRAMGQGVKSGAEFLAKPQPGFFKLDPSTENNLIKAIEARGETLKPELRQRIIDAAAKVQQAGQEAQITKKYGDFIKATQDLEALGKEIPSHYSRTDFTNAVRNIAQNPKNALNTAEKIAEKVDAVKVVQSNNKLLDDLDDIAKKTEPKVEGSKSEPINYEPKAKSNEPHQYEGTKPTNPREQQLVNQINEDTLALNEVSNMPDNAFQMNQLVNRLNKNKAELAELKKAESTATFKNTLDDKLKELGYKEDELKTLTDREKLDIVSKDKPASPLDTPKDPPKPEAPRGGDGGGVAVKEKIETKRTMSPEELTQLVEKQSLDDLMKEALEKRKQQLIKEKEQLKQQAPARTDDGGPVRSSPSADEAARLKQIENDKLIEKYHEYIKKKEAEIKKVEKEIKTISIPKTDEKIKEFVLPANPGTEPYWAIVWENGKMIAKLITPQVLTRGYIKLENKYNEELLISQEDLAKMTPEQAKKLAQEKLKEIGLDPNSKEATKSELKARLNELAKLEDLTKAEQAEKLALQSQLNELSLPYPNPAPNPNPNPNPNPYPTPQPIPQPKPDPVTYPMPQPKPKPNPEPDPTKNPNPDSQLVPVPPPESTSEKIKEGVFITPKKAGKTSEHEFPEGTITWRQGALKGEGRIKEVWHVVPPPYDREYYLIGQVPRGAGKLEGKTPDETVQVIGGKALKNVLVNMGIVTARVYAQGREIDFDRVPVNKANSPSIREAFSTSELLKRPGTANRPKLRKISQRPPLVAEQQGKVKYLPGIGYTRRNIKGRLT